MMGTEYRERDREAEEKPGAMVGEINRLSTSQHTHYYKALDVLEDLARTIIRKGGVNKGVGVLSVVLVREAEAMPETRVTEIKTGG